MIDDNKPKMCLNPEKIRFGQIERLEVIGKDATKKTTKNFMDKKMTYPVRETYTFRKKIDSPSHMKRLIDEFWAEVEASDGRWHDADVKKENRSGGKSFLVMSYTILIY